MVRCFISTQAPPRIFFPIFYELLENTGSARMRIHVLRHKSASLLPSTGMSAIIVSMILIHGSVSITEDVYGHVIPGMHEEAAEMTDNLAGFEGSTSSMRLKRAGASAMSSTYI